MDDPNKVLVEILREDDKEFDTLVKKLEELQDELHTAPTDSEKKSILKRMRSVRERVEARISYARSA